MGEPGAGACVRAARARRGRSARAASRGRGGSRRRGRATSPAARSRAGSRTGSSCAAAHGVRRASTAGVGDAGRSVGGQPAAEHVVAERGQPVAAADQVGDGRRVYLARQLVKDRDEPGTAGPGGSHCGSRARLGNPCQVEAWRANIHEPTRHQGASAQAKDSQTQHKPSGPRPDDHQKDTVARLVRSRCGSPGAVAAATPTAPSGHVEMDRVAARVQHLYGSVGRARQPGRDPGWGRHRRRVSRCGSAVVLTGSR